MSAAIRVQNPLMNESLIRTPVAEAPDRGHLATEPKGGRSHEAPDAGYGRMDTTEHEYTHGRSQS
jgi:hypothetical protein